MTYFLRPIFSSHHVRDIFDDKQREIILCQFRTVISQFSTSTSRYYLFYEELFRQFVLYRLVIPKVIHVTS